MFANCRPVAILARSSREMYLTVRIVWQYILSRVRVSVRPSIFFLCEKHSKPRGNRAISVYFNGHWPAIVTSGAGRHGCLTQPHRIAIRRRRRVGGCAIYDLTQADNEREGGRGGGEVGREGREGGGRGGREGREEGGEGWRKEGRAGGREGEGGR